MRRLCTARRKDGQPCKGPAVTGADKCRMHLGKKTAIVKLEREARAELARLDLAPVEDPLSELARVCAQVLAWKDAMAARVSALPGLRYETETGEQLRAEVALWERALDRCERFLTAMARLDIDARLARISEARAVTVIEILVAALDAGGVTGEQRDTVLSAADREFAARAGVILQG